MCTIHAQGAYPTGVFRIEVIRSMMEESRFTEELLLYYITISFTMQVFQLSEVESTNSINIDILIKSTVFMHKTIICWVDNNPSALGRITLINYLSHVTWLLSIYCMVRAWCDNEVSQRICIVSTEQCIMQLLQLSLRFGKYYIMRETSHMKLIPAGG